MAEGEAAAVDYDADYEEVLVYVDFPDFDECALLTDVAVVELMDLSGDAPKCKIGDLNFVGQYEMNLGTQLFVDKETGQCIGSSASVLNFQLKSIDTAPKQQPRSE
jgi:hypothetical protein